VYGNDEPDEMYDKRILGMGIDGGFIYQADTLEEAAALVKADYPTFDEDLFLAEVARYNELVAAGEDTDFGKRADLMLPIAEAPFFIEKVGPNKMCAPGGALITGYGQVIDEEENPIEGLYAVGNCSGGLYAVDYPLVINGNSHGRCITFGYLLGRQLTGVEEVQSYPTRA
jgi:fumarate reductase flavoprotein subunit